MKTPESEENSEEWVVIREDTQDWTTELADMLTEKEIPTLLTLAPGCSAGSCGCKFHLMVTRENVQEALENIDEYYLITHPELRVSKEWEDQDRCPACGHHVGKNAKECPDCGLLLIVEG
ncbi:MAG: hypothetical protein GY941_05290 [Planctomycetes bacterium]|nr:hypothetical protein [Planctomycetota bacterium]